MVGIGVAGVRRTKVEERRPLHVAQAPVVRHGFVAEPALQPGQVLHGNRVDLRHVAAQVLAPDHVFILFVVVVLCLVILPAPALRFAALPGDTALAPGLGLGRRNLLSHALLHERQVKVAQRRF
jgi:hypothetical protein